MNGQDVLNHLKGLYSKRTGRGTTLKRALLCVAVPAAAGLATACYGVPMEGGYPLEETEICSNGYDDDHDGNIDCDDSDCERLEVCLGCSDGIDNDGSGRSDCADPTCADLEICAAPGSCDDGEDNDLDGTTDCFDPDCAGADDCI